MVVNWFSKRFVDSPSGKQMMPEVLTTSCRSLKKEEDFRNLQISLVDVCLLKKQLQSSFIVFVLFEPWNNVLNNEANFFFKSRSSSVICILLDCSRTRFSKVKNSLQSPLFY